MPIRLMYGILPSEKNGGSERFACCLQVTSEDVHRWEGPAEEMERIVERAMFEVDSLTEEYSEHEILITNGFYHDAQYGVVTCKKAPLDKLSESKLALPVFSGIQKLLSATI